ncbi:MAG: hypothetical protein JKY80_09350 [Mariprofundaceae bacterium]|nr:hypothetical protein [Mariprofundaceae bacterium]
MVDQNDTKFEQRDANFKRVGLDGTAQIGGRFNDDAKLGADIAASSPEAKKTINDLLKLEDSRMESEVKSQTRSREFRVLKEKDRLTEKFFNEPSPMPNTPEAKALVYQTIDDQANRVVDERQKYYREQIPTQTDKNIREVLKLDREGLLSAHDQSQKHDQDHEWEGR